MDINRLPAADRDALSRAILSGDFGRLPKHLLGSPEVESLVTRIAANDFDAVPTWLLQSVGAGDQRSTGAELGRQLGLSARYATEGLAAIPAMVGDAGANLMNLIARRQIATPPSQSLSGLLDAAGLPQPETRQERIAGDVSRAIASIPGFALPAAAAARAAPTQSTQDLARFFNNSLHGQATAASLASLASGAVRESEGGPASQMAAAVGAGMIAPGGGAVAGPRAAGGAAATVQPFSQAGREAIVGSTLRRFSNDPERAIANLEGSAPLVRGSQPLTSGASRDPGLAGMETPVRAIDEQSRIAAQVAANNVARRAELDRLFRDQAAVARAEQKRSAVTTPMRDDAFANAGPIPATTLLDAIDAQLALPANQQKTVQSALQDFRSQVARIGGESGQIDPQALYAVRKDVNLALGGKLAGDRQDYRYASGQLIDLKRSIDTAIESVAPGFQDYLAKFERMSRPINQMTLGQMVRDRSLSKVPDLQSGVEVPLLTNIKGAIRANADDIAATLTLPQRARLEAVVRDMEMGAAASSPGLKSPGSDTFRNMSVANVIGRMFSDKMADNTTLRTLTRPLDFLYKLPDQRVQQLLVDAMLNPRLAADLMKRASTYNVEPVAKTLRRKVQEGTVGATVGGAE